MRADVFPVFCGTSLENCPDLVFVADVFFSTTHTLSHTFLCNSSFINQTSKTRTKFLQLFFSFFSILPTDGFYPPLPSLLRSFVLYSSLLKAMKQTLQNDEVLLFREFFLNENALCIGKCVLFL